MYLFKSEHKDPYETEKGAHTHVYTYKAKTNKNITTGTYKQRNEMTIHGCTKLINQT